ncbi:MAG TPA: Uma2 family endonuclease [Hyphomicrobiaceae bacterium]|nr:Uma2 family endonuclease [Hyphomicrobiaceae bacterium]
MSAHTKQLTPEGQLTIDEFLAYTDTRPDGERWELIEGVAVMNPSPVEFHQLIVLNIGRYLMTEKERAGATWTPLLGVSTRVPASPRSLPQPDAFVKEGSATDSAVTNDALVIFEVLSKSNSKADQAWRRKVYASVPNCQHYVTVSLKAVEVDVYDRDTGWKKRTIRALSEALTLPAIGIAMPLVDIYRWTPLA